MCFENALIMFLILRRIGVHPKCTDWGREGGGGGLRQWGTGLAGCHFVFAAFRIRGRGRVVFRWPRKTSHDHLDPVLFSVDHH